MDVLVLRLRRAGLAGPLSPYASFRFLKLGQPGVRVFP